MLTRMVYTLPLYGTTLQMNMELLGGTEETAGRISGELIDKGKLF